LDLNFGDFQLLDVTANMLLKSSTFIRCLQMDLYRSNINLKIDIPYSLPLPYIKFQNDIEPNKEFSKKTLHFTFFKFYRK